MDKQSSKHLPSHIELLAALCSEDHARQTLALQQIVSYGINWESLLTLAQQHHVSPLLYRCLNLHGGPQALLTELQHASLRQACRNIKMHNLRIETELLRISALLNKENIRHIVYKGPALARSVFHDLGLRQFNDFDLLTSWSDTFRVQNIMLSAGYHPIVPLNGIQKKKLQYFEKEITYIKPESGQRRYEADIHWLLLRPALRVPLTFETLWQNTVTAKFGDIECQTLNKTYTLFATCIHNGGNEAWNTLKQVADLDAILRRWGHAIDWYEIRRIAKTYDLELLVSTALILTHEVFYTPLPATVLEHVLRYPKSRVLVDSLKLFAHPEQLSRWEGIRQHMRMRRTITSKAKIIVHSIFESLSPNFADGQFLPLPGAHRFFPLYYLIRPFRVLFTGKNAKRFGGEN